MTNRIYQSTDVFEVANRGSSVEFSIDKNFNMTIHSDEEAGWDSQSIYFTLTEDEVRQLVAFLIAKGY